MAQQPLNLVKIFRFPVGFVVLLWLFHFYKITFLEGYPSLGIYPREVFGLQGILTSPLSHGDFQHLISNSLPLLMTMTWTGIFRRNNKSIILSLVIVVMYSGYFYGIVPNQDGISWESHLFGAVVGVFVAFILKDLVEPSTERRDPWINESDEVTHYLRRDQFDYTKAQRLEMQRREAERLEYLRQLRISQEGDQY